MCGISEVLKRLLLLWDDKTRDGRLEKINENAIKVSTNNSKK